MSTRVRFAPSPTGPLHIGGVRTALFNYLFAHKNNGTFILRLEDTDQKRFVEGAEEYIEDSLKWLDISPTEGPNIGGDFGPYRQSERMEIYQKYIPVILESGYAYYAFDTPEELDAKRKEFEAKGKVFSYNAETRKSLNNSLNMSAEQLKENLEKGVPYVIRFKMPENEDILINDQIRGKSVVNSKELDDKVLVKADGMPTYHFANVIDDHLMEISDVIRGEEWLPSMPLHIMLYKAFDWNPPQFAHLPLILKPEGNGKLSKRDGAQYGFPVFPMEWNDEKETFIGFKELGYYPEAVINFLSELGWTPEPENEILALQQLWEQFSLEKVHKSGARFDIKKAEHINKEVLQSVPNLEIIPIYEQKLADWDIDSSLVDSNKVVRIMKERCTFINELVSESLFFYQAPKAYNEELVQKVSNESTREILEKILKSLENNDFNGANSLSEAITSVAKEEGLGMGKVMMPLRLALVGAMKGPDVPDILSILGKEESINRIQYFANTI